LESSDRPGEFIRHDADDRAVLQLDDGTGLFNLDSNWGVSYPVYPTDTSPGIVNEGSRYGFEDADRTGQYWRH